MFALALAVAAAATAAPVKIAVYDVDDKTASPIVARVITDAVAAEIRKLDGVSVVGMDEIRAMLDLEAQKALAGCSDASCVAEIAEGLGVDGIVIGDVAIVGRETVFGLKRIDQRQGKTVAQFTQHIDGIEDAAPLALVGPAVEQLFRDHPLKAGEERGVSPKISVRLAPPPLDPWVVWTGGAVAGALVVGAGVAATFNAAGYLDAQAKTQASIAGSAVKAADFAAGRDEVRTTFTIAAATGAVALVVGAGTGIAALFTDWDGVRAENEAYAASLKRRASSSSSASPPAASSSH